MSAASSNKKNVYLLNKQFPGDYFLSSYNSYLIKLKFEFLVHHMYKILHYNYNNAYFLLSRK
jgi:hypothetical protein